MISLVIFLGIIFGLMAVLALIGMSVELSDKAHEMEKYQKAMETMRKSNKIDDERRVAQINKLKEEADEREKYVENLHSLIQEKDAKIKEHRINMDSIMEILSKDSI